MDHWNRVDLAHVFPGIFLHHILDHERPGVLVVVGDLQSVIVGDDMTMYCENRFGVGLYPCNLQ